MQGVRDTDTLLFDDVGDLQIPISTDIPMLSSTVCLTAALNRKEQRTVLAFLPADAREND